MRGPPLTVEGNDAVTRIKIRNASLGSIAMLRVDGTWYDKAGNAIPGLYATGNSTSSVNGPSYPGAGASIGASLTFGYAAARHAARANQ